MPMGHIGNRLLRDLNVTERTFYSKIELTAMDRYLAPQNVYLVLNKFDLIRLDLILFLKLVL